MTEQPPADHIQSPPRARRTLLMLGGLGVVAAGLGAAHWFNPWAKFGDGRISVEEAHERALRGDLLLIDIRRPDEWALTGIGQGAHLIDMRRSDFIPALDRIASGDRSRPVALICARGVRSRNMARNLREAGFANVFDVPEGMLGSGAGPGWLARGLPLGEGD